LNFQNYVWFIEESQKQLLQNTISPGQYEREINSIYKRMQKSGFNEEDRANALLEGERNALITFQDKQAASK
jgi:hypothetical protein